VERDKTHQKELKQLQEQMQRRLAEFEDSQQSLKTHLDEVQAEKERLLSEKIKQDTINDQSMTNIVTLQNTLQKKEAELKNFQIVIGNLNESVMEKEREC
jgi:hypothetical protein